MTSGTTTKRTVLGSAILAFLILVIALMVGVNFWPVYTKHPEETPKSKMVAHLRAIHKAQNAYYDAQANGPKRALVATFAGPSELVPGNPTEVLCDDGEPTIFTPTAATWRGPVWMALKFSIRKPLAYAYQVESTGVGPSANFTVRAIGDLDCDGIHSTFELMGQPGGLGRSGVYMNKENE